MKKEIVIELALVFFFIVIELILLIPSENLTGFVTVDSEIQADCGANINGCCDIVGSGSFTLTQSISTTGSCINITKSNVSLDCNGFTIFYATGAPTGAGINISDTVLTIAMENVTVRNCIIRGGSNTSASQYGIWFNRPRESTVTNNTITTAGTFDNIGFYIRQGSGFNNFTLNTITTVGTNAVGGNVGIYGLSSTHNTISNNSVTTKGAGANNTGIYLEEGQNNTVQLNNISANGTNNNHGIRIYNNRFNRLLSNRIKTFGNESTNIGILLQELADGTLIDNNSIVTGGVGNAHGIFIQDNGAGAANEGASQSNISNNTIITNGTSTNNIAVFASTAHHRIIKNNITTNGSADNHGIYFTARSQNNTLEGNNISVNGTNSYGVFINDSNVSRLDNNTINISTVNFSIGWISIVLGDGNNFTNTTFANRNGTIRFPNTFTPNGTHNITQDKLNISNHTARVNSTNLTFLNASAQLSFVNVTFSAPYPVFIGSDSGSGEACSSSQCIGISFVSGLYIYNVTRFTTYSASESNVTFSLTKTDNPDPVAPGATLTYAITFSITNGNATNITIHDVYDPNVTFVSSDPTAVAGSANRNFSLPNLSTNGSFTVNITVSVNESFSGTLNNTASVLFQNGSGNNVSANVSEFTTVRTANPGGGGRIISSNAIIIPKDQRLPPQPVQIQAPMQAPRSTEASLSHSKPPILVTEDCKTSSVASADAETLPNIPQGYDVIGKFDCSKVINIPDYFTDPRILRCNNEECVGVEPSVSEELMCNGKPVRELRNEERQKEIFTMTLSVLSGLNQQVTLENPRISSAGYTFEFVDFPPGLVVSADFNESIPTRNPIIALSHLVTLRFDRLGTFGLRLTIPFAKIKNAEVDSIAVAFLRNKDFFLVEGLVKDGTIKLDIDDITEYLDDGKLSFVVVGSICKDCSRGKLVKEYSDGVSRRALILVHGITIRTIFFRNIIDEFSLTSQPWQVWTYRYPYDRSIEETGKELADLLEANTNEFDEITLLGHSLGGFVVEQSLVSGQRDNHAWVSKVRKSIIAGTPHKGTPTLNVFKEIFSNTLNSPGSNIFQLNAVTLNDLSNGKSIPMIQGVDYEVIAGTESLPFTKQLFNEENDGVTTSISASTIGDLALRDRCNNYYDIPINHLELDQNPLSIKIINRILNKELVKEYSDSGLAGYNQYLSPVECSDGEYFVIGKRIAEEARPDPLLCSCGNQVCGVDENESTCPVDCIKLQGISWTRYFIEILLLILFILLLIKMLKRQRIKYPPHVLNPPKESEK